MKQIHSLDKSKWFCVFCLYLFRYGDILKIWNLCLVHNGIIITFFFPCSLHDKFYKIKINCLSLVRVQDSILLLCIPNQDFSNLKYKTTYFNP